MKSLSKIAWLSLAVAGALSAAGPAAAQEVSGKTWIDVTRVEFYGLVPGIPGSFHFYNNDRHLRGLTTVDEDNQSNYSGNVLHQEWQYTTVPTLPSVSNSLATANGSAYGLVNGTYTEAGCTLLSLDRTCQGYGGVSTTASSGSPGDEVGFWNLYLGAHTGVVMDAHSFAQVTMRDHCVVTCGDATAVARLFAQFAPESPVDPGLPIQNQLVRRNTANVAFLDGSNVTGSGGMLQMTLTKDLHLVFENNTDQELMGRIRWDTQVVLNSPVPEPETYALMALGLGLLALRRRKKA